MYIYCIIHGRVIICPPYFASSYKLMLFGNSIIAYVPTDAAQPPTTTMSLLMYLFVCTTRHSCADFLCVQTRINILFSYVQNALNKPFWILIMPNLACLYVRAHSLFNRKNEYISHAHVRSLASSH